MDADSECFYCKYLLPLFVAIFLVSFLCPYPLTLKSTRDMIEKVNIGQVMNQYQIVTDADHVYVEKGNSQGKINKSDLISKLLAASELDKIKIISKSVVVNQKLSLGLKNGLYFLIGSGNFGFCDLVSVYKKEITVIANEGYGTLIIGTDNIIAGQHCIYINETDNKIEFKQYSDVMNVTFGGIIA